MTSVAKVIKIVASSPNGVEDAIQKGLAKASHTLHGIHGLKVTDWTVNVEHDKIASHKVTLEVAFGLDE
jgi:flavin-binding protein dodecin